MSRELLEAQTGYELIELMSEENPEVTAALQFLWDDGDDELQTICEKLDRCNIRGEQIFILLDEVCDGDPEVLAARVHDEDESLIEYLNSRCTSHVAINFNE